MFSTYSSLHTAFDIDVAAHGDLTDTSCDIQVSLQVIALGLVRTDITSLQAALRWQRMCCGGFWACHHQAECSVWSSQENDRGVDERCRTRCCMRWLDHAQDSEPAWRGQATSQPHNESWNRRRGWKCFVPRRMCRKGSWAATHEGPTRVKEPSDSPANRM